jgi:hypothetical protein
VARKFITSRELNLVHSWNRELIEDVVEQEIIYYAISYEDSRVHDVYDEAVLKEYYQPVRINGRIEFTQLATSAAGGTLDSSYGLDVELHVDECTRRNVVPREGDFVEHGRVIFEITTVGWAEPVFGQINDRLAYKLTCVPSREGQFKADSVRIDGVDNTHPVEPARPRTLGDDL